MTILEKQKIASFLDLAGDFHNFGYKGEHREYDFPETDNHLVTSLNTDSIEKIAQEINKCEKCPLFNTRKNTVPGEGVNNPLVLVIGEGPGADEDNQGRPFVGKAGQLLDKMLSSIKLSRTTNCFIANVVKCRPPQNRDPYPEETAVCRDFLQRQILVLKPKFILLVGNVAAHTVIKSTVGVGKIHGKFFDYKTGDLTIPLLVTYHPSALLHNEDYKRPAWEDLKLLKSKIDSLQE